MEMLCMNSGIKYGIIVSRTTSISFKEGAKDSLFLMYSNYCCKVITDYSHSINSISNYGPLFEEYSLNRFPSS